MTFACRPPAGTVAEPGDCHDGDTNVRPGRAEPRCDGQDEDCDGTADDDFELGTACETELGCAGTRVCRGDLTAAVCSSTQSPTAWYVDGDGDGRAGTLVAASCKAPPDAVATSNDCDDTSRFIGGTEVCDKLDNNCDGRVDEGSVCGSHAWTAHSLLGVTSTWAAVAAHGPGQVWLAGAGGRLEHVSLPSTTQVPVSSCAGDWRAAWARPSDGRVFLGSAQGELATTTLASGAACPKASVEGVTSAINGMVGMERDGVTTVYAVTSGGHVLRWEWPDAQATPSAPVVMERLAANLRSVHGLDANTLFAVGAEDFQVGGTAVPRVFRFDAASGHWVRESLPAEAGSGYLHGVSVVDGGLAYAVGDQGLALLRQDGTWRKLPPPTGTPAPDLLDVIAFHSTVVYAVSDDSGSYILRYNGTAWSAPIQPDAPLLSLDATGPQEVWASGNSEMWVRWGSQNP